MMNIDVRRLVLFIPFVISLVWIVVVHVSQDFFLIAAVSGALFSAKLEIQQAVLFFELMLLSITFLFGISDKSTGASVLQLLVVLAALFVWGAKLAVTVLSGFKIAAPIPVFIASSFGLVAVISIALYRTKLSRNTIGYATGVSIVLSVVFALSMN